MKLQTRLTALVSFLVLIVAASIGVFAIKTTEKIQYQRLDDRLNSIVSEIINTEEDPLSLASLLSDESNNKFSVAYISAARDLTTINESNADLLQTPSESQIKNSLTKAINLPEYSSVRIRSISLPDNQFVTLSISTEEINKTTNSIIKYLIIFTFFMVLISILISSLLFRRDNQLNELVSSLQRNKERMQTFIGDASHELRTPITVIKGYFQIMRKKQLANEPLDPDQLNRIDSEVNRMTEIISDLLFLTELDQVKDDTKARMDLSAVISDQIEDLKSLQPERKVNAAIEGNIEIEASKKYIDQIFANIFSNLKRHTPENSEVFIQLTKNSSKVSFTIEDSGPGLPEEFYQQGIQAFQRFDQSRSRETGGSGLGMTIIRKSVEKVGGKISLSNSKSGGLKISITF